MYKFNDEPEKCFLGQKVDNTIKKLGAIATMGLVKTQFKEFKAFEKNNTNTLTKGKTEIQEKVTMLIQEFYGYKMLRNRHKVATSFKRMG